MTDEIRQLIYECAGTVLLGYCTYTDLRTRKIGLWYVIILSVVSAALRLVFRDLTLPHLAGVGMIFLLFLTVSLLSKKAFGLGDVFLTLFLLILLGIPEALLLLFFSFLLTGITGFILALVKKENIRKKSLPFCPFLQLTLLVGVVFRLAAGWN